MKKLFFQKPESLMAGIFALLMLGSFLFLAAKEQVDRSRALHDSSWNIYFQEPIGNNIDFSIENYSPDQAFTWQIIIDDKEAAQGRASVNKQEKKNIDVSGLEKNMAVWEIGNKKILIRVRSGAESKEIYKYL